MAFNGKLIQLKTGNSYVDFPIKYIKAESYEITPNQRMESNAVRSVSGVLQRTTCTHTASKIEFNTTPLTNAEVNDIHTKLSNAYSDSLERKLTIKYYDPESDSYKESEFYVPDIQFPIMRIESDKNIIHYDSIRYAFIEY